MALSKEKKSEILKKLKIIVASKSAAFVNFHGLTVANATLFRRKLKESGVGYFVAKKTLIKKSLTEANVSGEMPDLKGEVGVAYLLSETPDGDLTAPTRESFVFQKKFENRISLLGGVFEGKLIGAEEVKALALIPSLQTLRAQFVNLINSPIQRFAVALDGISKKKV